MPESTPKERITRLKDGSMRVLRESEQAVEHQFHEARLLASLAFAFVLVGFLLVAQWRGTSNASAALESRTDQELAAVIQELAVGNESLRSEALRLEMSLARAELDESGRADLLDKAKEELRGVRTIAGLEAASGPGVIVRLEDPERVLLAQDIVALVNELHSAGAEAVAIGPIRIDARSGVTDSPGGIRVDGSVIGRSIEIAAIGGSSDLEQALALPGGIRATLTAYPGVTMTVLSHLELEVPVAAPRPYTLGVPIHDDQQ
ncbi:MAG: DUF881 domain-containing protein [Coriobacteriia bacterium]|nr:DUF881 domain-containing protein [Coriobacteriia bacterium]MBN2821799.1 DUF881 domain-containing protein [Coriobacteriia bacterium]